MSQDTDVVRKAEQYYDSDDADRFYFTIWGGEDIHVGLYERPDEPIRDASARTVAEMAKRLEHLPKKSHLLDIGAGYGGSGRYLIKHLGIKVTSQNLSEVQNARNRQFNREQGLAEQHDVVGGNFEELPFEADSFDAVWSQDAILHSGRRKKVFEEVDRVLKPGGDIILTDPMQVEGIAKEDLQPVLDRIHLDTMGSIPTYRQFAADLGWKEVEVVEMREQLINHYSSVLRELEGRDAELKGKIGEDYIERMKQGLRHWIEAGQNGRITWGILHFRKG